MTAEDRGTQVRGRVSTILARSVAAFYDQRSSACADGDAWVVQHKAGLVVDEATGEVEGGSGVVIAYGVFTASLRHSRLLVE